MATVGIWKICTNLGQVIRYVCDKEKTNIKNYKGLDKSLEHNKDEFETEEKLFVDGINCNPSNALKEMNEVKKKFMKTDKILGWHAYHSYKEGEVTPEEAHRIGLEVASEMWGDRFQVVVSTHVNGKCIHNHFVINSVSFVDGKKYYANRTTYAELRRLSNAICSENGLSTLEEKKTKSGINYLNYQNKSLTYTNYYKEAKKDLDFAIMKSKDFNEFKKIMNNMGYTIINRAGKLSIRGENYKRNIRIERYYGEDYSIDNINKQIKGQYISTSHNYYTKKKKEISPLKNIIKPKYNSFYSLYIKYYNMLNGYSNYVKKSYVSSSIRKEIKKLDEISNQIIFLSKNKIETLEDFSTFMLKNENDIVKLKNTREEYWKKTKKVNSIEKEKIKDKINTLNTQIKELNNNIKMCEKIIERNKVLETNLQLIKEMVKNEHIK